MARRWFTHNHMRQQCDGANPTTSSVKMHVTSLLFFYFCPNHRIPQQDIPGCDCGSAEVEEGYAAFLCDNGKSLYCDLECVDDADPANVLIPGFGGLWCRPQDWLGCRLCKMDCSDYAGLDCVPCPTGVKNWC